MTFIRWTTGPTRRATPTSLPIPTSSPNIPRFHRSFFLFPNPSFTRKSPLPGGHLLIPTRPPVPVRSKWTCVPGLPSLSDSFSFLHTASRIRRPASSSSVGDAYIKLKSPNFSCLIGTVIKSTTVSNPDFFHDDHNRVPRDSPCIRERSICPS